MEDRINQVSVQILISQMLITYRAEEKDPFDRYCAAKAIAKALGQELEGQKLKYWFLAFLREHDQPQTEVF